MTATNMQIVIAGTTMDHNPTEYAPIPIIFEQQLRGLDGTLSKQYLRKKYQFELDNLTVTQWQLIMRLCAKVHSSVTYQDNVYIVQTLNGDGSTTSFDLNRAAYSSLAAQGWIDGTEKTITYTALTNPGATQIFINATTGVVTCGVTPTDSYDNIEIYYVPIYNVILKSWLKYLPGIIYGYRVILEEV